MKTFRVTLFIFALFMATSCERRSSVGDQAEEYRMMISVMPSPPMVGASTIQIELMDGLGNPTLGATLNARGDMTHAGMVPVLAQVTEQREGEYSAIFEWTMAGDWILTVEGDLPDGRFITRTFELIVLSSDSP